MKVRGVRWLITLWQWSRKVLFLLGIGLWLVCPTLGAEEQFRSGEFLSPVYTVDRLYKSMEGPESTQQISPFQEGKAELIWITGYEAVMVGPDGENAASQEFMCHSNLDFSDVRRHNRLFGNNVTSRLFTLSQGQFSIRFPSGSGLPVMSDEPLSLTTQVLNHNLRDQSFQVRHKVTLHFVRDHDLVRPLKPLFTRAAYGLALLQGKDGYFGLRRPDQAKHGPGCLVGAKASEGVEYKDGQGRLFTGHWVVEPGRQVNRTLVTRLMDLPYDTRVHYIAVHLHPFAESLELIDRTAGETVFRTEAENFKGRIGLARVEYFSSEKGVPLYKKHEYELFSVYNNTTPVDQDSMAVMYLYLLDKRFRPDLRASD